MRVASRLLSTAAVAAAMTVGLVGAGLAQEATPTAMGDVHLGSPFPNHFHLGSCDDLDPEPAVPLADLQFPAWAVALASEDAAAIEDLAIDPDDIGNAPIPVAVATTEVAAPLADIVSGKHALNVHNPEDPSQYVACGNIGGVADERGDLFVGLAEFEDSGFSGAAWLHDNGASTTVVVLLTHAEAQTPIGDALGALAVAAAEEAAEATPETAPAATPVAEVDATPVA